MAHNVSWAMAVYVQRLLLLLLLSCEGYSVTSRLVCQFGQFELLCSTSGMFLGWNIDFPDGSGVADRDSELVSANSPEVQSVVISDSTVLLITRTSSSPLTSQLEINNTIAALNGTRIKCTQSMTEMIITVITVFGNGTPVPQANVSAFVQHYSTETVTITLEWSQEEDILYDFTVLTSPQAEVQTTGSRAVLVLYYNTHYNVSVVSHLCGQNSTTTLQLHYVICSVPVTANITNYSRPTLEGTNAIVNCIGSNKSVVITCMDNGSWEPNPNERDLCLESTTVSSTHMATQSHTAASPTVTAMVTRTTKSSTSDSTAQTIGVSLGILVALIICILIAIFLVITVIKYKGVPCRRKARFHFEDRQQTVSTGPTGEQNASMGQYSLLQAFPARENTRNTNNAVENAAVGDSEYSSLRRDIPPRSRADPRNTSAATVQVQNASMGEYSVLNNIPANPPRADTRNTNTSTQNQKLSLVYADVGPLSFKQRRGKPDLRVFDDDRVQYTQVDLTRLQKAPKKTEPAVKVDKCSPIDNMLNLDNLLLQIKAVVTPKWREFGKAIGVDDEVLNKCLEYAQEESIIEVCDKWLRNHSGKPTWREVAEALRQIGDQKLAFEIENSYNTGKLPKSLEEEPVLPELVQDEEAPPIPPRMAL